MPLFDEVIVASEGHYSYGDERTDLPDKIYPANYVH